MRPNEASNPEGVNEAFDLDTLRNILEGLLLAAARPLSLDQLQSLLGGETAPDKGTIRRALTALEEDCARRGVELVEVASGYRLQVRQEFQPWVSKLWEERPPRYSRALLETLALIAYRQPITRGEIEDVRGVSVSTNIIRQLEEREWIRVVGHRDVPGKPALFGTTKAFLDYFGLKSLDDLPSLAELRDIETLEPELDFSGESAEKAPEAAEASAQDEAEAASAESEAAESGEDPESGAAAAESEPAPPEEAPGDESPETADLEAERAGEARETAGEAEPGSPDAEAGAPEPTADSGEASATESGDADENVEEDAPDDQEAPVPRNEAASAGRH